MIDDDGETAYDYADRLRPLVWQLVEETRRSTAVPHARLRETAAALDALRSAIARDPEIEVSEFHYEIEKANALIGHLRALTPSAIRSVAARAATISPEDTGDALTLLLIGRLGPGYWELVRDTLAYLDGLIAETPTRDAVRARWTLRAIVPTHAFNDRKLYPSYGRGASRATHVESVTPSGLPSLGKRT